MSLVAVHTAAEMTFRELADAYCAVVFDGADLRLRKWVDAFGHQSAWSITTRDLSLAAEAMAQSGQYKPSTINRDLSTIGTLFKWALRRHLAPVGFTSPTIGLQRYSEDIRRVEVSEKEIEALIKGAHAYADRRFACYVRLLIDTGARRGEVRERRWRDVNLEARSIEVIKTKTDRPRQLFFTPATADLMRRVWPERRPDDLLFAGKVPGQPIDYKKSWLDLVASIGRPDLHQHDLRHHRAAELLRAGTTIAVAAQVLGHSAVVLERRYGHLESETLRRAAEGSWKAA
ncbi:tyrosine-type recombinase/integrase [Paraburkholderia ferrariae]|uniref:Site-specific integrase n=1 Tax=Paraburkholderia ferrariae TaxID=386056 RepID=A0ABU9RZH4_9BURK